MAVGMTKGANGKNDPYSSVKGVDSGGSNRISSAGQVKGGMLADKHPAYSDSKHAGYVGKALKGA